LIIKIRYVILLFLFLSFFQNAFSQQGRLENEYKLSIPQEDVENLWKYLQDEFCKDKLTIEGHILKGVKSVEKFKDVYYDNEALDLIKYNIGLRYRKRYKDDVLLKILIQLKTPYSLDAVVRNEFKFEPDSKKNTDINARHSLLKHIDKSSLESLEFELSPYKVRPKDLAESVNLVQVRSRIYLSDTEGESVATLTLDEVSNYFFPYQSYAEMELEINEVRYTNAQEAEKKMLTDINEFLKSNIQSKFVNLEIDQRPKYNKMKELIDNSILSMLRRYFMWIVFGLILTMVLYKLLKQ